jgi:hypothetical protein
VNGLNMSIVAPPCAETRHDAISATRQRASSVLPVEFSTAAVFAIRPSERTWNAIWILPCAGPWSAAQRANVDLERWAAASISRAGSGYGSCGALGTEVTRVASAESFAPGELAGELVVAPREPVALAVALFAVALFAVALFAVELFAVEPFAGDAFVEPFAGDAFAELFAVELFAVAAGAGSRDVGSLRASRAAVLAARAAAVSSAGAEGELAASAEGELAASAVGELAARAVAELAAGTTATWSPSIAFGGAAAMPSAPACGGASLFLSVAVSAGALFVAPACFAASPLASSTLPAAARPRSRIRTSAISPTGRRAGTRSEPDPLESCGAGGWRGAIDRPGSLAGRG